MRVRGTYACAILTAGLFAASFGCGGKPEPPAAPGVPVAEFESVKKENAALKETLGQKTALLNEVQDELDALAKSGEVLLKAKQEMESGVKTREQGEVLRDNVAKAKKMLEERAGKIKALQARLTGSEQQLKQVMDLMTKVMLARSEEIDRLDDALATLRGEKKVVEEERDAARRAKDEEAAKRKEAEAALDTAYVAVGTEDELRARGILAVEKKVFKKKLTLAPVKSYEPFQKISIEKDRDISLGKGVKSYETASGHDLKLLMKEVRGDETILRVDDPKAFWRDKVLVIIVKR